MEPEERFYEQVVVSWPCLRLLSGTRKGKSVSNARYRSIWDNVCLLFVCFSFSHATKFFSFYRSCLLAAAGNATNFQSCLLSLDFPPECTKLFVSVERIEGIVRGMYPRDRKAGKVGKDGIWWVGFGLILLVMRISENLHHQSSNIRGSPMNLIVLISTVILGYSKSFQMVLNDADHNVVSNPRVRCCARVTCKYLFRSFIFMMVAYMMIIKSSRL